MWNIVVGEKEVQLEGSLRGMRSADGDKNIYLRCFADIGEGMLLAVEPFRNAGMK